MAQGSYRLGGLSVALIHQPWVPYVQASLVFRCGTAYEDQRTFGYSHLLEHLLFLGGDPPNHHLRQVEDLGGDLEASTGRETTFLELQLDAMHLGVGLPALARVAFELTATEQDLEREKLVIEHEGLDDDGEEELDLLSKSLLWPGATLFEDALGDTLVVQRATLEDLRTHHQRFYVPANGLLVVAGGYDPGSIQTLVAEAFEPFCHRPGELADYSPPDERQEHMLVEAEETGEDPIDVQIAWRAWPYDDPRDLWAYVLAEVVGGPQTSRLFQLMREQDSLAYTFDCYTSSYLHAGAFSIHASVLRGSLGRYLDALEVLLRDLRERGPSGEELRRARRSLGRAFGAELYTPGEATEMAVRRHLLHLPPEWWDPDSFAAGLEHTTTEHLRRVATELFQPQRTAVLLSGGSAHRLARGLTFLSD